LEGGGWIDFARKIWGSARKMNFRTNMIKQDETRKLDYIDCGKSLKNLYLRLAHIVLLSSMFVKHALNSHFVKYIFSRCPKNCSIARKKLFCPTPEGYSPPGPSPPAHAPMLATQLTLGVNLYTTCVHTQNRVPASAGVRAGISSLSGGRYHCVIPYGM